MHRQISKKIFIYLFIYIVLVTLNNVNFSKSLFPLISNIEIFGLSEIENKKLHKKIKEVSNENIFYLDKKKISETIYSNKIVEKLFVYKNYPSKLKIDIKKVNLIAITKKNNLRYYIGSNGNLIETKNLQIDLPFVFGNVDIKEFLKLKKIIDDSDFNFDDIKNLYYFKSKRWDLETEDGLVVKLPHHQINSSLDILLKFYEQEDFKKIKIIDFRNLNQVIIND